jgi:hypothetical protein
LRFKFNMDPSNERCFSGVVLAASPDADECGRTLPAACDGCGGILDLALALHNTLHTYSCHRAGVAARQTTAFVVGFRVFGFRRNGAGVMPPRSTSTGSTRPRARDDGA